MHLHFYTEPPNWQEEGANENDVPIEDEDEAEVHSPGTT
jgi:hypothetical protein